MTAIIHVRIISIAEFPRVYLTVTTVSKARELLILAERATIAGQGRRHLDVTPTVRASTN